jgi:hypothetical protein
LHDNYSFILQLETTCTTKFFLADDKVHPSAGGMGSDLWRFVNRDEEGFDEDRRHTVFPSTPASRKEIEGRAGKQKIQYEIN